MVYRPWKISTPAPAEVEKLKKELGIPELACRVMAARDCGDPQRARELCGAGRAMSDPMEMKGMAQAVERIHRAMDDGERIVVFGDYDVDGVTAAALLYTYLDAAGADVYYKLPNREDDGYGLSEKAVELMAAKDVTLIITVDNGISAVGPVARAAELGIDVVVTDHHLPPSELPQAAALVDPQLPADSSGCQDLSGAGVAFKLIAALDGCTCGEMLPFYGDLAAIGTIADIMPLEGENRTLVKAGLALLQETERPGLAALIRVCGLEGKPLTAENVSFGLAPRLNAAGRMDDATAALQLLLCEDEDEAEELARALDEKNAARQQAEQEIAGQIAQTIAADPAYQSERILVVWGHGWHQGVIGIVASRVVERFGKPAIIISVDDCGQGKGSGRSVGGVSLYEAIRSCAGLLTRFGGHEMAAGLSIEEGNLQAFRREINRWAAERHPVPERPALNVDASVQVSELNEQEVRSLDVLAPFGSGNPSPLFVVEHAVIEGVYAVGEGRHSRLRLRQGKNVLYAVLFGKAPAQLNYGMGDVVDAVVALSVYEGKNGASVSARIKDLRPSGLTERHLALAGLAEALQCGASLDAGQRASIRPQRADTAAVYRFLAGRREGVPAGDLRPVFAKLGEENTGKILISLAALEQLELVERAVNAQGTEVLRIVPSTGKKDLASAPVLRSLEEG